MTAIIVQAEDGRRVLLHEPDEDGDYVSTCQACGYVELPQPMEDTIRNADVHLSHGCPAAALPQILSPPGPEVPKMGPRDQLRSRLVRV